MFLDEKDLGVQRVRWGVDSAATVDAEPMEQTSDSDSDSSSDEEPSPEPVWCLYFEIQALLLCFEIQALPICYTDGLCMHYFPLDS